MRIRHAVLAAFAAFVINAAPARADDAAVVAEITAARTTLNEAFAEHDAKIIAEMMTPDHLAVTGFYHHPVTTAEELEALADFKSGSSAFTHTRVTILGPAVVEITFEKTIKGTFEGEPLPQLVFVAEVWLRQDGKWLQQLYQETPIEAE